MSDGTGVVDQMVFRWAGSRGATRGAGITAVAHSCDERTARDLAEHRGSVLRVKGGGGRTSVVRLIHGDRAVLLRRMPDTDGTSRESNMCHALMAPAGTLTARLCLALGSGPWKESGWLDEARGRIPPFELRALQELADTRQGPLRDGVPFVREPLVHLVAELLRAPGGRVSARVGELEAAAEAARTHRARSAGSADAADSLDDADADAAVGDPPPDPALSALWALCDIFGNWLGNGWTYATYDTSDAHPHRVVFVADWRRSHTQDNDLRRIKLTDPGRDRAAGVAELLVDHYGAWLATGSRDEYRRPLQRVPEAAALTEEERYDAIERALTGGPRRPRHRPAAPSGAVRPPTEPVPQPRPTTAAPRPEPALRPLAPTAAPAQAPAASLPGADPGRQKPSQPDQGRRAPDEAPLPQEARPAPCEEVRRAPDEEVRRAPGGEARHTPSGGAMQPSYEEVRRTSSGGAMQASYEEMRRAPDEEVGHTPSAEVRRAPGGEVRRTPSGEVRQAPSAEVRRAPDEETGRPSQEEPPAPEGERGPLQDEPDPWDDRHLWSDGTSWAKLGPSAGPAGGPDLVPGPARGPDPVSHAADQPPSAATSTSVGRSPAPPPRPERPPVVGTGDPQHREAWDAREAPRRPRHQREAMLREVLATPFLEALPKPRTLRKRRRPVQPMNPGARAELVRQLRSPYGPRADDLRRNLRNRLLGETSVSDLVQILGEPLNCQAQNLVLGTLGERDYTEEELGDLVRGLLYERLLLRSRPTDTDPDLEYPLRGRALRVAAWLLHWLVAPHAARHRPAVESFMAELASSEDAVDRQLLEDILVREWPADVPDLPTTALRVAVRRLYERHELWVPGPERPA